MVGSLCSTEMIEHWVKEGQNWELSLEERSLITKHLEYWAFWVQAGQGQKSGYASLRQFY